MEYIYKGKLLRINYLVILRSSLYWQGRLNAPCTISETSKLVSQNSPKKINKVLCIFFSISMNSWIFDSMCFSHCHEYSYWYSTCSIFWPVKAFQLDIRSLMVSLLSHGSRFPDSSCTTYYHLRPEQPGLYTHPHSTIILRPTKKCMTLARQLSWGWICRMGSWRLWIDYTHHSCIFSPFWKLVWVKLPSIHCTCKCLFTWVRPPGRLYNTWPTFIMFYSSTVKVSRRAHKEKGGKDQTYRKKTRKP